MTKLGEIADLQAGVGFPPRLQGRTEGHFPFAKVGDISSTARSGGQLLTSARNYVSREDLVSLKARVVPRGSTLFAKIGEAIAQNFRVMAGTDLLIDNNAMAAIPRDTVAPRYLYRFLQTVDMYQMASTTSVPSLRKSDLERIEVPLPPLPEQRRIADILDRADDLRAKRRRALALLDSLANSAFNDMFGDPAVNAKAWPVASIGEMAKKFSDGPFGSNLKSSDYRDAGVRVIRLQNIGVGHFNDSDRAYISVEHFESLRKHECVPGDVLIGTLGDPNLRATIQPDWLDTAINKADCVQLRPDPARVTAEYVAALINHPSTMMMASGLVLGQTRSRISMGRLRTLRLPIPPIELQRLFTTRVQRVQLLRAQHLNEISTLDELFASLQHRAFQGEL